jgi:AcrR family transcriptional regulator
MVEVKRPSHRERQAQATRRLVARAARPLFAERGYTATTIEAISTAADVPEQTIYSAFGSKRAILEEARVAWIEEADVVELYATAMSMPGLCDRLRAAAHWTRRQFELGHDVITAYQEAARVDPIAADFWRKALDGREVGLTRMIRSRRVELRRGLSSKQAVHIFIACTLPEAYGSLVIERRWTPNEYERWLADLLCRELIGEVRERQTGLAPWR